MGWRAKVARLLGAGLLVAALLRVELASGFGQGTGVNKVHVSPLSVTAHFGLQHLHQLPKQVQPIAQKFIVALAIPGEFALEHGLGEYGLIRKPKTSSKKKKLTGSSLEKRALDWCSRQKNDKGMKKFLEENTFAIAGGIITLFAMIASFFVPYEGFQNVLLGIGCFWFGANGAHGSNVQFTNEFFALIGLLVLSLFLLAEAPGKPSAKELAQEAKAKAAMKKKNDDFDEWDDGIGGVSMAELRKKKAAGACGDGCCG